jgi:5'-3' exoribonuclease 2
MGIPFYFKKLLTTFGKHVLKPVHIGSTCDVLYLDFNCLIHQCANAVVQANPGLKQAEYEPLVIDGIIVGMLNLINVVRPTKMLYIGIDGLCPRAKMTQQRKRRYMSAWRKAQEKSTSTSTIQQPDWDSNIITPGTRFMTALDAALADFIQLNVTRFKFAIELSPSNEPGEGEHKIFEYMRKNPNQNTSQHVIYGLDADLILLSLSSPQNQSIRLLRERPEFGAQVPASSKLDKAKYIMVDIGALARATLEYYGQTDNPGFIDDYVMLATLLGNDFVPPLSYLNIRDNGIEMVVDAYRECVALAQGQNLIHPETKQLDIPLLDDVICALAKKEDHHMTEACNRYYNSPPIPQDAQQPDTYPQYHKHMPAIQGRDWRAKYYAGLFSPGSAPEAIASDYADGLCWVHAYYFKHDASMTWYYPHAYSPLASDVQFRTLANTEKIKHTRHSIYNALVQNCELQLLAVLPPSSSSLLKDASRMNDVALGCAHFYPTHFAIHTFLKTYLWECSPVLPTLELFELVSH